MSYTFPSVTINYMTFTAKRFGQSPTITYDTTDLTVTAGHEVVIVADDLSDITIKIEDLTSNNAQIKAAILASDRTVQSLMARDLVDIAITSGHTADANTAVAASSMTGGSSVPPPSEPWLPSIDVRAIDPENPIEGQVWYSLADHAIKYFDGTAVQTVAAV
jgi:hypothetical protein